MHWCRRDRTEAVVSESHPSGESGDRATSAGGLVAGAGLRGRPVPAGPSITIGRLGRIEILP